mgnify:CR=1 FL=1
MRNLFACCVSLDLIIITQTKPSSNKASTTSSLDLCPACTGDVVGQASFLFHISQQALPILEGITISGENQNKYEPGFISH